MSPRWSNADPVTRGDALVLSCEHAGYEVPRAYRHLFAANEAILRTHRGYDIGIVPVARKAAKIWSCPLLACRISRLLIEPNRSLHHRSLFSEFSRDLPATDKHWLIEHVWRPHRQTVIQAITNALQSHRRVLHLSWHSFTPVLDGRTRTADIGLLYDPRRDAEKRFALTLQRTLQEMTNLRIRRNYPYRGRDDGLTTALRRLWDAGAYLGLEIELNQNLLVGPRTQLRQPAEVLCKAIQRVFRRLDAVGPVM